MTQQPSIELGNLQETAHVVADAGMSPNGDGTRTVWVQLLGGTKLSRRLPDRAAYELITVLMENHNKCISPELLAALNGP